MEDVRGQHRSHDVSEVRDSVDVRQCRRHGYAFRVEGYHLKTDSSERFFNLGCCSWLVKLFFATGNPGKVEEMRPAFREHGHELEQVEVDIEEIQAVDVEKVARRKVIDSATASSRDGDFIVEDTGFFVESLGGFPGAMASFFHSTAGAEGLLRLLENRGDRSAYFKTAIAAMIDGEVKVFSGRIEGTVPEEARGEPHPHLPYDALFVPDGAENTFAEQPELKEQESHRIKATRKLLDWVSR